MLIIANGDAHTAGTIPTSQSRYNYQSAWPRWVAESYGCDLINIAEPGSGNEQIFRSTIISVGKVIKEINPKEILVLVMWAGFKRYEFWNTDNDKHDSLSLKSSWNPNDLVMDYVLSKSKLESDTYTYYKDLFYMYTLSIVLESYGVQYNFMQHYKTMVTPDQFKDTPELSKQFNDLYKLYGDRVKTHIGLHNESETYQGYLKSIPAVAVTKSPYWGVDGQKAYAKFIKEKLDFNQKISYN